LIPALAGDDRSPLAGDDNVCCGDVDVGRSMMMAGARGAPDSPKAELGGCLGLGVASVGRSRVVDV